jgi:Ca2+-binding EF-hand superfamily protein
VSCSRETENYYQKVHGYQQVPVFVKPDEPPIIKHEVPPYNGWGSEEDSLASCMSLVPTAVQRDMLRFMENQGKTLRFQGRFKEPSTPADAERRFVFTYYLEDETVAVFEPPIRNSGVIGGKFLTRGRYKLAVRSKSEDELNASGERDKHPLVILLKEKMSQYMSGGSYMLLNAFKHFGGIGGNNSISLTEFQHGCRMCGMPLSRKDAKILFAMYDADNSGSISFQEFVDGIMADNQLGKFGSDAAKSTARWIRPSDFFIGARVKILFPETGAETCAFTITGCDEYTAIYKELHPHEFPKSNVEFIVRELATKLQQYNVNVRQAFRSYDRGSGQISHAQFKTLLQKWAKDFGFVDDELSEEDAITLVRHYDDDDDGTISINEFCDALTAAPIAFRDQIDESHVEAAERNLWEELHVKPKGYIREEFNKLDERGDGHITIDEFKHFLERHDIELNERETAALFLHYDPPGRGFFEYSAFARLMEADHFISTKSKPTKGVGKKERFRSASMSSYIDICKARESTLSFDDRVARQMKAFCRFFYPRRTVLRKAFLSHDNDGTGVLNKRDWLKSINKANPEVLPSVRDAFMHQIFPMEKSACPFQEFMDVVFRQDVASYNRLLNRGCRLDRRETWGNVSSTIGGDWE